jgi:hypothetical protein
MGRKRKEAAPAPGLREVAVAAPSIKMLWVDPESITPNPLNWRVHPEEQSRVVGDLIERHGWLRPLLFNSRTGLLIDGHDRREIALAKGLPAVPVWIGEWSDEQEAEILVSLDESARMAGTDLAKLDAVMKKLGDSTEGDDDDEGEDLEDDEDEPGGGYEATPSDATAPAASHTRVVSLFLTGETYPEFQSLVKRLGPEFGFSTDTDTVMESLRRTAQATGLYGVED